MQTNRMILTTGLLALVLLVAGDTFAARVVIRERITVTVDRNVVQTDVPPIMVQGRTLVPVRSIFEGFGAQIEWIPCAERVYIREGNQVIWLRIGASRADINGRSVPLDVPAMLYRGRTMVPLRFIAESLGATVSWDPATETITIVTREGTTAPEVDVPEAQVPEAVPS